jgi:cytochrome c biogenesis protein CcmG, thiol:disulfide interchange protein DsbE
MDTPAPAAPERIPRNWLKIRLIVGPALAVIALLVWATYTRGNAPQPGDAAPTFAAERLDGSGSVSLEDFEGKPLVINFWASWCLPCEDEAPLFSSMARRYDGEVSFLGVNIKDAKSDAQEFEGRFDVSYPSVRDEGRTIEDSYGLTGQPETFLITADGIIHEHIPGAVTDAAYLQVLLDELAETTTE